METKQSHSFGRHSSGKSEPQLRANHAQDIPFSAMNCSAPPEASRKIVPKLRLQDENSPPCVSSRGNLVKAIPISGSGLASSPLTSNWGSSSPSEGGSQTARFPSLDNTSTAFALLTMNSPATMKQRPVSERGTARGGGMDSPFTQRNGQKKEKKKREMGNFTPSMGGNSDRLAYEFEDDGGREEEEEDETTTESDENEMEDVEDTEAKLRQVEERMKYHDLLHEEQDFSKSPPQPLPSRSPIEQFLQSHDTEDEMEEVVDRECLRKRVLNPAASASQPVLPSADSNLALPRRAGSTGGFRSPSPNSAPAIKQTRRHSKQYSSYTAEKRADWPEPAREGGEKRGSTSSTQHCSRRVKRKQSGEDKRPPPSLSYSSSSRSSNDLSKSMGATGGGLLSRSTSSFDMFFNSPGSGGEEGLTRSPSFSSTTPVPVPSSPLTTTPFSPTVSPLFSAFPLNFSQGSSDPSQRRRKGSLSKKMCGSQERSLFDDDICRGTASGELPRRAEGPSGVHPSRRKKVVGGGTLGSEHSGPLMRRGSVSGLNLNYDRSSSFETKSGFLSSRLSSSALSTSPLPSSPSFTSSPSSLDPPVDLHKTHRSLNVDSSNSLNSPVAPNLPRRRGSFQKRGLMTRGLSHSGLPIPEKGFGDCLSPSVEPRSSSFVRTESTSRNLFCRGFGDEKGEKRKRDPEEESLFSRPRTCSLVAGTAKGLGENRPYLCRSCTSMLEDEMSLNGSTPGLLSSLPASNPPATEEKGALSKSLATALTCSRCGLFAGEGDRGSKKKKRTKTSENSNSLCVSQESGSLTERPGRRANIHFLGRPQNPFGMREEPLLEGKKKLFDTGGMTAITGETVREIFQGKHPRVTERSYLFVDCRFPYEYEGGHVKGAINLQFSQIEDYFLTGKHRRKDLLTTQTPVVIFYCEFSSKRGPTCLSMLRNLDRDMNPKMGSHLYYPQIYLLEGGYSKFWSEEESREHCEPCNYREMDDGDFLAERQAGIKANKDFKAMMKKKKGARTSRW